MAGCKIYPNRTSQTYVSVGYNGLDFLSFDMDNDTWILCQDNSLARYIVATLQNYTVFNKMLEVLVKDTCTDDLEALVSNGKAALERQGETTLTLPWPPQTLIHTEAIWCPA